MINFIRSIFMNMETYYHGSHALFDRFDLDHALDSKIREALFKIDNERKSLSGDIWSTPLVDL